jgi:hypothetical protein
MDHADDRWVPKVHPLDRPAEADDPYELHAEPVQGDPQVMLECMLQEFVWMGWSQAELLALFDDPQYPVLCQLRAHFGREQVHTQVAELLAQWGRLRFRETIVEPEPEPDLVQIRLPSHFEQS